MPTELVLLSEIEPTSEVMIEAASHDHPNGTFIEYRGGQIRQFLDEDGRALLSIHRTRPVAVAREAAASVHDAPPLFGLWTDLVIPYGDQRAGRSLAQSIASAVRGVIKDRA